MMLSRIKFTIVAVSSLFLLWFAAFDTTVTAAETGASERAYDVEPRAVAPLEAGIRITSQPPRGWSHMVLQATPRLGAGDVSETPALVAKYATTFTTVILANVKQLEQGGPYYLDKLAIGAAVPIKGELTIVTAAKHQELGAGIGFIGGRVLAASEEVMAKARQVARYPGMLIYDVPALMYLNNRHEDLTIRHVVWVAERSGRLGSAMWVMRDGKNPDSFDLIGDEIRFVPPGTREDRVLHVDGNEFTLGIPSARAFAMTTLPPGKSFPPSPSLRELAVVRRFDREKLGQMARALSETLRK